MILCTKTAVARKWVMMTGTITETEMKMATVETLMDFVEQVEMVVLKDKASTATIEATADRLENEKLFRYETRRG